jgi:hypothetical protein
MIDYRFGDRVKHPLYGMLILGKQDKIGMCSVWDGLTTYIVNVSDLTPFDPRIIQIGGKWHRVYTPLDVEEARELIGKDVLRADRLTELGKAPKTTLSDICPEASHPYLCGAPWAFIAVLIESEPEKKPEPDYEQSPSGLILHGKIADAVCMLMGIGDKKE